ncbi:hypothetical protein CSQ88_21410 [Iodobacter sp. BJB302]|nr:hypothetical protein CSQ88_21410 [Iodobacter sp. BJB302]
MARQKKSSAGNVVVIVIACIVALVASVPKEIWIGLGIIGLIWAVSKLTKKSSTGNDIQAVIARDKQPLTTAKASTNTISSHSIKSPTREHAITNEDIPIQVRVNTAHTDASEYRIPAPPSGSGSQKWIPIGQHIEVAGTTITGGMVYVGTTTHYGDTPDPSLIATNKPVAKYGDYTERQFSYWPSYSEISDSARRAYLNWLAGGRKDPEAEIGFVFLFFYGLERRVLVDAQTDPIAKAELSVIAQELQRLLKIYGPASGSFRSYAGQLYDWISMSNCADSLYLKPVPTFPKSYDVPVYIRLALGQAAIDSAPVPATLALAWIKHAPNISLRTPATRCESEFSRLFTLRYHEKFVEGLLLPRNKTKLKFQYRPASAGLLRNGETKLSFGDIPDVTVLTGPLKKLQEIVESTTKELESYSRYLSKNLEGSTELEGVLLLPPLLWPDNLTLALKSIQSGMEDGEIVMPYQKLLSALNAKSVLTKDKAITLAKALESMGIGIEPNLLGGAKLPKLEDTVVLFDIPAGEIISPITPAYQIAVLTLQLASSIAAADGDFDAKEAALLREQIQSWTHLTPYHNRRLLALLRLLVISPASLTSLKKQLEPLDIETKEILGSFMATVAQSDEKVTIEEIKMLEKVYKVLGIDSKKVFSDIHAASPDTPSVTPTKKAEVSTFKLDSARIAALQQDTAKVSVLLANIFNEEAQISTPSPSIEVAIEQDDSESITKQSYLLGLDESHDALARMLLSRPQWNREELLDVASDLDLMLDGALERINEATYDVHDIPFTEGDDPIEVNAEVLEKIEA